LTALKQNLISFESTKYRVSQTYAMELSGAAYKGTERDGNIGFEFSFKAA
jgi:hypothetical protein